MSYEGYSQFLCKNGHQWTADCMMADDETKCPACFEEKVWENMVDVTNGSFDDEGKRCDGYVELKVLEQKSCDKCQSILETKYEIPKEPSNDLKG